jgi:hypothetical protein
VNRSIEDLVGEGAGEGGRQDERAEDVVVHTDGYARGIRNWTPKTEISDKKDGRWNGLRWSDFVFL